MGVYYSDKIKNVYAPKVTKSTSRYNTKLRLVDDKQTTMIRFIRNRDLVFNNSEATVHVVSAIEAFRPDIIAYKYFGDTKYSWIILAANDIRLPYGLKQGMKILIPSLATLQGSNGKLVTR